jgi:hypothetical protein
MFAQMRWNSLTFVRGRQTLTAHLISPDFKAPAIPKAHVFMPRAAAIGLVRFAQEAARTRGFWAFALMVHGRVFYTRSTKLSTTFFSPAFSNAMVSLLPSIFTTWP